MYMTRKWSIEALIVSTILPRESDFEVDWRQSENPSRHRKSFSKLSRNRSLLATLSLQQEVILIVLWHHTGTVRYLRVYLQILVNVRVTSGKWAFTLVAAKGSGYGTPE